MATANRVPRLAKPVPPGTKLPIVRYEDVARKAGLTGVNISGAEKEKVYIIESTGTGVAVFDYDNDGLLDILLINADSFQRGDEPTTHYLYRNVGDLRFVDVTKQSGLVHSGWGQGVCAGDVDNDGNTDLLVTHWGRDVLFHNQGDGTFADETEERGLNTPGRRWSTGCSFLDFDRDGDLDLFVVHYVDFDPAATPRPGDHAQCLWKGIPVLCGPRGLPGESMSLFENDGHGSFVEVSEKAGVAVEKNYYGFTPLTADFDADGWTDIFVACDSTASLLFRNQRDGTFEEIGLFSGTAYNEDGQEQAGMGATAADYDRDGRLDIFKTNFSNDTHTLYRNEGDWSFTDETVVAGLAVNTQYVGWGTAFIDVDHDGWKDLFVVNGHVYPSVDDVPINETFKQPRLLYWNLKGEFFDISSKAGPAIRTKHSSRGIAVGDLDNDGRLEIVVVNMHEGLSLLKNFGETGNSILVRALTASGRDAIGARVSFDVGGQTQIDEVRSGGYHISQSDFRVHFGMGNHREGDLVIHWPSGKKETIEHVEANQWVVVREGQGVVKAQKFREVPTDQ